jgi:hypothetical protein
MEGLSDGELRHQILIFLKDFKELMGQGHYIIKNHLKNLQALRDLGITARTRDEIILAIGLINYSSGPNLDKYLSGDYWVFGSAVDSVEVYIKLKIITYNDGRERAVCLSFHPSEGPLTYPLRS